LNLINDNFDLTLILDFEWFLFQNNNFAKKKKLCVLTSALLLNLRSKLIVKKIGSVLIKINLKNEVLLNCSQI